MHVIDLSTFDQALGVARRLNAHDRARLIARLADELAAAQPLAETPVSNAWTNLLAFNAEIREIFPDISPGARLESDRRERDDAQLRGDAT